MSCQGRTRKFATAFRRQPLGAPVHWGQVKLDGQRQFLAGARMVVPRLKAGDIIVAHSFLAHGTSANTSDVRRDMIFQRRAAVALATQSPGASAGGLHARPLDILQASGGDAGCMCRKPCVSIR